MENSDHDAVTESEVPRSISEDKPDTSLQNQEKEVIVSEGDETAGAIGKKGTSTSVPNPGTAEEFPFSAAAQILKSLPKVSATARYNPPEKTFDSDSEDDYHGESRHEEDENFNEYYEYFESGRDACDYDSDTGTFDY